MILGKKDKDFVEGLKQDLVDAHLKCSQVKQEKEDALNEVSKKEEHIKSLMNDIKSLKGELKALTKDKEKLLEDYEDLNDKFNKIVDFDWDELKEISEWSWSAIANALDISPACLKRYRDDINNIPLDKVFDLKIKYDEFKKEFNC